MSKEFPNYVPNDRAITTGPFLEGLPRGAIVTMTNLGVDMLRVASKALDKAREENLPTYTIKELLEAQQ
jgi:hypothetical protein